MRKDTAWRQRVYEHVGTAMRRKREAAGLSTRVVSERVGIAQNSVIMYEGGGMAIPLHYLVAFAQLVGCTVQELLPTHLPCTFERVAVSA